MSGLTFEVLQDFVGTISFMALLAVCYGAVMRAFAREVLAQSLLGLLFGSAAIVAMWDPLQLADGVIVDMRSVPVTLAGAFLGPMGAIVTSLMTLGMRIAIGGDGMISACISIVISASVGLAWATYVRRPGRWDVRNALVLASLSLTPMVTVLLLPWDTVLLILTNAWPIILPLKFAGVFVLASLLDREQKLADEVSLLGRQAMHDPLTGLLNRRGFEVAVENTTRSATGSALLLLDLDHFKGVNDTYGHGGGDAVLQALSMRLSRVLKSDDILARFGGDEFIVFLPNVDPHAVIDVAARLCRVVRDRPFVLSDGSEAALTMSVGGAWTRAIGQAGYGDLMSQADAAVYSAKLGGRACWRVSISGTTREAHFDGRRTVKQESATA